MAGKLIDSVKHKRLIDELSNFQLSSLKTDNQKIPFLINIYNGITNFLIISLNIKNQVKENITFFNERHFQIDSIPFSLDDLEHGLLRKNARNHLSDHDIRMSFKVEKIDYRVHFALNCGGSSCPIINTYTSEAIEEELASAEKIFSVENFLVNNDAKKINCSPIYHWYQSDFPGVYLNAPRFSDFNVELAPYNWHI